MADFILCVLFLLSITGVLNTITTFSPKTSVEALKKVKGLFQTETGQHVMTLIIVAHSISIIWKPLFYGIMLFISHESFLTVLKIFFK